MELKFLVEMDAIDIYVIKKKRQQILIFHIQFHMNKILQTLANDAKMKWLCLRQSLHMNRFSSRGIFVAKTLLPSTCYNFFMPTHIQFD